MEPQSGGEAVQLVGVVGEQMTPAATVPGPDRVVDIDGQWQVPAAQPATPSFFCRLVDEVVYWNTSRFSG